MKILIVEDSDEKAHQAEDVLRSSSALGPVHIVRAKSFIGATRKLETTIFDLLILDLVIPIRDNELPSNLGGKQVLAEILNGVDCKRPSHIICLTAFRDIAAVLQDEVDKSLLHVVYFDDNKQQWREALKAKTEYVLNRLNLLSNQPVEYQTDIAIITSSPIVELSELKKLPVSMVGEFNQDDAIIYYSATWKSLHDRSMSVIACAAPRMGMTAACVTACKVIDRWRPRFLVMTGIAAATKADLSYGDILVAESAYDYGSGKIIEVDDEKRLFVPSPSPLAIDPNLHAILQRWEQEQTSMDTIRRSWHETISITPRLILGILASGAAVVQNQEVVDEILRHSRKVVGLDMEAYALFQAAHLCKSPRPRILVAKSVSDFADKRKDDNWQQYAAFTSARFIYEFFTHACELVLTNE